MPKGKSAKDYKRMSFVNQILGIIMLAALIYGIYLGFNYLKDSGILENSGVERVQTSNSGSGAKETSRGITKKLKNAADIDKKVGGF